LIGYPVILLICRILLVFLSDLNKIWNLNINFLCLILNHT